MQRSLVAAFTVWSLFAGSPLAGAEPEMTFSMVGVTYQEAFRQDMRNARIAVRDWWGPTYEGPITVEAPANHRGASMALVPAWRGERGRMLFSAFAINQGIAASVHEMIHVYAPNSGRMLAEGLATYYHDKLGGRPAYPNSGKDLHVAAAPRATKALLLSLERIATPQPLPEPEQDNYLIAGSFVRFLIETEGFEKFRALYDLTPLQPGKRDAGAVARWSQVYGRDLEAQADAWVAVVKAPRR